MFKKFFLLLFWLLFISIAHAQCPATLSDQTAINIAQNAMNDWFTAIQKGDMKTIKTLLAPQFIILHSQGAPMTREQELELLTGFHLGGYHFSDFCAMKMGDTIIATFASKTFKQDISQSGLNFLSSYKAYRMVVMQQINGQWSIIAYANTNPIH